MKPLSEIKPGDPLIWWEGPGTYLYVRRVYSVELETGLVECDGADGHEHTGAYGVDMWPTLFDAYKYYHDFYKENLDGLVARADALYFEVARAIDQPMHNIDDMKRVALWRELQDIESRVQALIYCIENEINKQRKELLKCNQNNQETL